MKTILWATLSANGNYARANVRHPPRPEALADFAAETRAAGNFIVGRQTFQDFQANAKRRPSGDAGDRSGIDIVVVSRSLVLPPGAGVACEPSPREAVAHLRAKGHTSVVVAGGEALHNAFLAEGLVDELVVLVTPSLEDDGRRIVLAKGQRRNAELLDTKVLGGGVVRLRYALGPADAW